MFNSNINVMIWKDNTIGITKSDILFLINIVKDISAINKDNNLDDDTKDNSSIGTTIIFIMYLDKSIFILIMFIVTINYNTHKNRYYKKYNTNNITINNH